MLCYNKQHKPNRTIMSGKVITILFAHCTLSSYPADRLSSLLVNSAAKKYLDFRYGVIPLDDVIFGGPSPPSYPLP